MNFDQYLDQQMANGDLAGVYQTLQDEFHQKYTELQQLFKEERELRHVLSFYSRRNNAILDLLEETETALRGPELKTESGIEQGIEQRIDNIMELNPALADLAEIKAVLDGSYKASDTVKMWLLLQEAIPELEIDDTIKVEKNPQDTELWLRRNYGNLVQGKFKPMFYKNNQLVKPDVGGESNGHSASKKRKKNV